MNIKLTESEAHDLGMMLCAFRCYVKLTGYVKMDNDDVLRKDQLAHDLIVKICRRDKEVEREYFGVLRMIGLPGEFK